MAVVETEQANERLPKKERKNEKLKFHLFTNYSDKILSQLEKTLLQCVCSIVAISFGPYNNVALPDTKQNAGPQFM